MVNLLPLGKKVFLIGSGQVGNIGEIRKQPMPHGLPGKRHVYIVFCDDGDVVEVPIRRAIEYETWVKGES